MTPNQWDESPSRFAADRFSAELEVSEQETPPTPYFHFASYLIGLLTALLLVGGMTLLLRRPEPAPIVLHAPPTLAPTATPQPTPTIPPIVIFVSGAVREPGMYTVAPDARVGDALTAAGGMTLQANPALVNQAERLWDGAQIHVPAAQATAHTATIANPPTISESPATILNSTAEDATAIVGEPPVGLSGTPFVPTGRSDVDSAQSGNLINLNQASPAELETLPGIGPSKAAAIVANRPYSSIDDLARVPGIGPKTIENFRALVTVE